jgi:hypothetical protein
MLAVPADRLPAALGDLDPGNRALLDLSLRRGVSDSEIGELLRKDPADVALGRDAVLELLADALDVAGHDRRERVREAVVALPDEAWRPATSAPSPPSSAPSRPSPPTPRREPDATAPRPPLERERERAAAARKLDEGLRFDPEPRRLGRGGLLALLGLLAVIGAVVALIAGGGDDDEGSNEGGSQPAPAQGGPEPEPGGRAERLSPLQGERGEGRVSITDAGATITVRGLPSPDGTYQVWLYDSVVRAKSLGTLDEESGRLEVQLPPDAGRYRFLDVSLEPADANPNHSGDSVLRAPLRDLLRD